MSLNASLNTAVSGLQANQTLMRIVSANITSANVEGYTKKRGELENVILNSLGAGVNVADITRSVDEYLLRESNGQNSVVAATATRDDFYTRMQDQFGSPDNNNSIAGILTDFQNALESLALDPSASVQQFGAVNAAQTMVTAFQSLSKFVQNLRSEADRQIDIGVDRVNASVKQLEDLNDIIIRNTVTGEPLGDFLDQRDRALNDISQWMDVKYYTRSNGAVAVLTGSNYALLDASARSLSYTSPSGVSAGTVYPGGFQPISIAGIVEDLTPVVKSGKIAALIEMRDTVLPGLQAQLDQLAASFSDQLNRAHSSAMPIPGPTGFKGVNVIDSAVLLDPANNESVALQPFTNTGVTPALTEYGTFEMAITDNGGDGVGAALRVNLDEFKSQMEAYLLAQTGVATSYQVTLGDVVNMINGAYAATPPTGIPVPATPAGWPAGATFPPSPALVMPSTGSDLAGLFNLSGAGVSGGLSHGRFAGVVNGKLQITLPASSAYGLAIDDTKTSFNDGTGQASRFNYMFGLNNLFVTPPGADSEALSLTVRADIAADPSRFGRGQLVSVLRDPANPASEEWYVAEGDGAGARAMADVFTKQMNFASAGRLPNARQSLSEYAASMIQSNATAAALTTDELGYRQELLTELNNRKGATSGVNVDEELTNLINIQNNYSASSRIVSTVKAMYDDLLNLL